MGAFLVVRVLAGLLLVFHLRVCVFFAVFAVSPVEGVRGADGGAISLRYERAYTICFAMWVGYVGVDRATCVIRRARRFRMIQLDVRIMLRECTTRRLLQVILLQLRCNVRRQIRRRDSSLVADRLCVSRRLHLVSILGQRHRAHLMYLNGQQLSVISRTARGLAARGNVLILSGYLTRHVSRGTRGHATSVNGALVIISRRLRCLLDAFTVHLTRGHRGVPFSLLM